MEELYIHSNLDLLPTLNMNSKDKRGNGDEERLNLNLTHSSPFTFGGIQKKFEVEIIESERKKTYF